MNIEKDDIIMVRDLLRGLRDGTPRTFGASEAVLLAKLEAAADTSHHVLGAAHLATEPAKVAGN